MKLDLTRLDRANRIAVLSFILFVFVPMALGAVFSYAFGWNIKNIVLFAFSAGFLVVLLANETYALARGRIIFGRYELLIFDIRSQPFWFLLYVALNSFLLVIVGLMFLGSIETLR